MPTRTKTWTLYGTSIPDADCWRPSVDVYRARNGWILKFDLAGVRLEDVTVALRGRGITVSGFRRDALIEEGASHYSMEISYNRFERTIDLPCDLGNVRLTLEGRNGILLIRLIEGGE